MYYPQNPKEPSGCAQTFIITRVILSILLIPVAVILGTILMVLFTFVALSENPLLALVPIAIGVAIVLALVRWESKRVARDFPPDER